VAEAVLTSEQVKELARDQRAAVPAAPFAELARLAEDFLMRDRPGDTGDRNGEHEEPDNLLPQMGAVRGHEIAIFKRGSTNQIASTMPVEKAGWAVLTRSVPT
jgi:hypothetical protein